MEELIKQSIFVDDDKDETEIVDLFERNGYGCNKVLFIIVIPTMVCNFSCKYCYQDHADKWMSEELLQGIFQFVVNNILNYEVVHIGWFGGEPLCALNQVVAFMRRTAVLALSHKVSIISSMSTNGYLLTSDVFMKLYSLGVSSYQITLDGFACIHNFLRPLKSGGGTFEKIISNLVSIKNEKKYDKARILIRINTSTALIPEMENFILYLASLFGCDDRFSIDFQQITDMGGDNIKEISDKIPTEPFDVSHFLQFAKEHRLGMQRYKSLLHQGGNICNAGYKNFFVVDTDGSIHKCTAALDDEVNKVGYLSNTGIMHFNDEKINLWNNVPYFCKCKNCKYYPICYSRACPYQIIRMGTLSCPIENHMIHPEII